MKINKLILGMTAFAFASGAFAQVVFHAGVDYTAWGLSRTSYNDDGKTSHTDPSAGYDPDGNMTIDVSVHAASFEFNLGLYFNADGGDEEYIDYSDGGKGTPFYQGNMKVGLFNDQVNLYTGKFEDFNGGYIAEGSVLGEQYITNLADSDYGPYLTGLEYSPSFVSGLKVFVGFPILPIRGNGIQAIDDYKYNYWKNLYKKAKFAASYALPIDSLECTVNAGWRPGTYYDGVDNGGTMSTFTKTFTESAFGEAYLQGVFPNFFDMVNLVVSYDLRYRDSSYVNTSNKTEDKTAFAHMFGISGEMSFDEMLTLCLEDRLYYAGNDYLHSDEKVVYNILAVNAEHALSGTQCSVGLGLAGILAADAKGTGFADDDGTGKINNDNYASNSDISLTVNDMATANLLSGGDPTTYFGFYAKPYFKYNFSNGALIVAAEVAYTKASTDDVSNSAFSYRIPIGIKFEF